MKSSPYGPYKLGYTRATMETTKSYAIKKFGANLETFPCSDYKLQLVYMKVESQVIIDQHAMVKMYLDLVHTARHMLEVSFV
jgi:hypothetical protein